jgi:predicted nucleic acid-binding protein
MDLIRSEADVAVTEPVIMEVLVGARSKSRENDLRRLMQRFDLLPFDGAVDFDAAVRIYRACRQSGVTPRGLIDCMIASVASRSGASLLAADKDLRRVADVIGVPMDAA